MHNAVLITEHTGEDLFKMLFYECDSAALCIRIHRIKTAYGGAWIFTIFVPVRTAALKREKKTLKSTKMFHRGKKKV